MFEIIPFFDAIKDLFFLVGYVSGYNLFPEPLSAEEEKICLEKYEKDGDENAKKILIERNLRLVAHIAKKYTNTTAEQEDIISIGTIGLIKAVNSYNSGKGVKLGTYASKCIENEILMYFRSSKKLQQEVSLNESIGQDKEGNVITFIDVIENEDISVDEQIDLKMKVKKLYEKIAKVLKDREKTIIELRFGLMGNEPKTQNEVAKMLGISRSYVSRIETKAISKLAKEIKD